MTSGKRASSSLCSLLDILGRVFAACCESWREEERMAAIRGRIRGGMEIGGVLYFVAEAAAAAEVLVMMFR